MTDAMATMLLAKRVAAEHRRVVVTLAVGLAANVLVYALLVYPAWQRVANVAERNQLAERALLEARRDHGEASGTLTGKDRAVAELATFYTSVLPKDLAGARRLTHLRLAQLARRSNLSYARASAEPVEDRDSTLTRLKIEMSLVGTYADMRSFIHQLETASEFVVIDNVQLTEGADGNGALEVRLELSTYYQAATS